MPVDALDVLAQFRELQELAEGGDVVSQKFIGWFDQHDDEAGITSTYPSDHMDGLRLLNQIGHTAELFYGARLLRWQVDHPGQTPTHFEFELRVSFESVD